MINNEIENLMDKWGFSKEKATCLICGNEFYLGMWRGEDCPKRGMATDHELSPEDSARYMVWQAKNKPQFNKFIK